MTTSGLNAASSPVQSEFASNLMHWATGFFEVQCHLQCRDFICTEAYSFGTTLVFHMRSATTKFQHATGGWHFSSLTEIFNHRSYSSATAKAHHDTTC